jgi:hypothetical protein
MVFNHCRACVLSGRSEVLSEPLNADSRSHATILPRCPARKRVDFQLEAGQFATLFIRSVDSEP